MKKTINFFCHNCFKTSSYHMFLPFLIFVILPIRFDAQDLSKKINNNTSKNYSDNNLVGNAIFDKLQYRLKNSNTLFTQKKLIELGTEFQNDVVLYSKNDMFGFDAPLYNYSNSSTKITLTLLNKEFYDNRNFFFIKEKLISKNFKETIDRNLFYYSYSSHQNNINTLEFSILSFQSTEASQLLSGTKLWGSIGFAMFGTLMILPRSVSKWEESYIEDAKSNFNRAFSQPPVMDKDHWEINYIGHPYAGSLYYNTIRSRGGTMFHSFLFSTLASTSWEYLYESMAEQPSVQDLIVTPILGSVLGELIHQATSSMKKNGYNFWEAAFVTIFNPMEVIQNGY